MKACETECSKLASAKPHVWKARLQLIRDACLHKNAEIRKRTARRIFYKLFKRYFREYYAYDAKRKASLLNLSNIYCGGHKGLVSIVLPVYNQAGLLEGSIKSVLGQTYDNFELIIVNDGSTDGVEAILDKYVTHPKVVILTQQNQKLPAALNTGFAHAKGEFYTWTSADNVMLPNQLEEQVRYLGQNDFVQMVYCNYELMNDVGGPIKHLTGSEADVINTDQDIRSLNYTYNFINACFLYRSYLSKFIGNYHPDLYGAEDYDYWMRINNNFAIQHIDHKESYYKYRVHNNTILRREGASTIDETIKRAQQLDVQRQSFFQLPVTFYVPEDVPWKNGREECLSGQPDLKIVKFETCKAVNEVLSNDGMNAKRGLFLTNAQMKEQECQSLVGRCKHDKMLFTFGIVEHDIAKNEIHDLAPLDWIIVATRDLYHSFSGIYGNKLLCLPTWRNCVNLFIIITNVHLFYRHIGRELFYPVPEHNVYQ